MKKILITLVVVLSLLLAPAAMAAEDPTCNLPVKPSWCTP